MKIKIETGIPLPKSEFGKGKERGELRKALDVMNIGESFEIGFEDTKDLSKIRARIYAMKKCIEKEKAGFSLTSRHDFKTNTVRFWRIN